MEVSNSKLNLSSTLATISSNLILKNATVFFDISSNISVKDCLTMDNSTIIVDLSNYDISKFGDKVTLLNVSGCSINTNSTNIKFVNSPQCISVSRDENDDSAISFLFSKMKDCTNNNVGEGGLAGWQIAVIIIVAAVIFLVLLSIILIFAIPEINRKIFPHRNVDITQRKALQESQL